MEVIIVWNKITDYSKDLPSSRELLIFNFLFEWLILYYWESYLSIKFLN